MTMRVFFTRLFRSSRFSAGFRAIRADTVEGHFVAFHDKSTGDDGAARQMQRADTQIVNMRTFFALEMVVMPEICRFVAGLATGQDHSLDFLRG